MKILFLGDVVGISGRSMILNNLLSQIKDKQIQDQIIETAKMIYFLWGSMFDEIEYKLNNPTKKVVC